MLQFRDFPSYRLRHGIRAWRFRRLRRKVWRRLEIQYAEHQSVPRPINLRLAVILGVGSVLACLTIVSVVDTLRAASQLERGRLVLAQAREEVGRGAFRQAASTFETARAEFGAASAAMDDPFVSVVARIPLIGRTLQAARAASEAGSLVADAGGTLSSAVGHLRGGLEALSFTGNRIPVAALERFHPEVTDALAEVKAAEARADEVATTFVPGAVVEAGDQLRSTLHQSASGLMATDAILRVLPEFTGSDRPRRYFLAPQDPSILRGTGGAFSYWAILKIERGRIRLQTFHYIDELPTPDQPEWGNHALEAAYGSVNAAGDWNFANAPADGPAAAAFISQLWADSDRKPIDGVMMIDVHALASMLDAIGPADIHGLPFSLTSSNVVPFLTNGAYLLPGGGHVRRGYVGLAGLRIFREFLARAKGYAAIRALVEAAAAGHILLNATDPAMEEEFQAAGVAGAIAPEPSDDLLAVTVNNLAGNRVDYYMGRTVDYDVTLLPDGRGRATASVTFGNESPIDPPTRAVASLLRPRAGPNDLELGDSFEQVTITCGHGCRLIRSSLDGVDFAMTSHAVGGLETVTGTLRIPPQVSSTLTMTLDLGYVWRGDGAQGTYGLSVPAQPTIIPTAGNVTIHAPSGMTMAAASPGVSIDGAAATWRGAMSDVLTLRTRFQLSTLGRIWWGLRNVL